MSQRAPKKVEALFGSDLPDYAAAKNTSLLRALRCRAVDIAIPIEDDTRHWIHSVWPVGEVVQRSVHPSALRGRQLEDRAVSEGAGSVGGSIEITGAVPGQARWQRVKSKAVEEDKVPTAIGRHQLKGRASTVRSSIAGRAVEVTRRVEDKRGSGALTIRLILEVVQNVLDPGGSHLEYRAMIVGSALASRAVQFAG